MKVFTRSTKATQLGMLWLFNKCRRVFKENLPSWHTTNGVDPNWYLTPHDFIIFNAHPHKMLLNMFALIFVRVKPRHLLGSNRFPIFGTGTIWPLCHSSKSVSSSQYLLNIYRSWVRFSLLRSLKAFDGKFFSPGKLSFFNFVTSALSSSHEIG